jgi:predicted hotdog family 3-hydroxylacyl-ACP dehydratase
MTALVNNEDILSIIPQRDPFVLIDELTERTDVFSTSSFLIKEGHLLVENGHLSAEGLIENIAQTAAAGVGYEYQYLKKTTPPIGYIGAVSKLVVNGNPPVGSTIKTTVNVTNKIMNVTIISGSVFLQDELLANCEMKIFVNEES